jgi:hypothetical protein
VRRGRPPRDHELPSAQARVVGANIRVLRQRKGWTQVQLGGLMGWPSATTVCAAEGRRDGRQRGFTTEEVTRLAAIFSLTTTQLTTRCATCEGHPPAGFACLNCGAQGTRAAATPRAPRPGRQHRQLRPTTKAPHAPHLSGEPSTP